MDLLDDRQGGAGIAEAGLWRPVHADVLEKFRELDRPGVVAPGVFPDRRLRRSHLRQHAIKGEPFDAVAAAETLDVQLRLAPVDLEREQVLPLGATDVEERGLLTGSTQQET